ncbi:MAG: peptide chain release factor 2 [Candidatus Dormibacteraeota bacterium]|nr:peptide chain release factor 2 [Candidatus Dormibacteraeota bacterium]
MRLGQEVQTLSWPLIARPRSNSGASSSSRSIFDLPEKRRRSEELEAKLTEPGIWEDSQAAGGIAREARELRDEVTVWEQLQRRAEDLEELAQLAGQDEELAEQVKVDSLAVDQELQQLELEVLFADPYASHNAVLSISAGQGGVDAQDWVEILMRMYMKWAQPPAQERSTLRPGCEVEVIDTAAGEEAGLKGATLVLRGRRAYGLLRAEHGVHRLVRISPFDQNHRRHTSFALVEVMPELAEGEEAQVEINPEDLRVDTYRSTGAGGQHVNKTDSAVRLTHLPTGIVVSCQNERSQLKNRELAMKVLRARIFQRQQEEAAKKRDELRGDVMPAEFGSQIRNYVLQPYTMVKDVRTGVEVGNAQAVLDGQLEPFLEGWLRWRLAEG